MLSRIFPFPLKSKSKVKCSLRDGAYSKHLNAFFKACNLKGLYFLVSSARASRVYPGRSYGGQATCPLNVFPGNCLRNAYILHIGNDQLMFWPAQWKNLGACSVYLVFWKRCVVHQRIIAVVKKISLSSNSSNEVDLNSASELRFSTRMVSELWVRVHCCGKR